MFIGSVIFRGIGLFTKWILKGFKGNFFEYWKNRNPNKEFEDILIGVAIIIIISEIVM